MLYPSAFNKCPDNNSLKPRVKPHPGQEIPITFLKMQSTSKTKTTSIPNTSSIMLIKTVKRLLFT